MTYEHTLYEEIYQRKECKIHTRIYEVGEIFYFSKVEVTPRGARGHYRLANENDFALAILAKVQQESIRIPH